MNPNLLLIHKSILPENYFLVIETRELIEKEGLSVSEACKAKGISRNTYYKYKDYVFRPTNDAGKKVIISFKVEDNKGVLSLILQAIHSCGGNIITINQEAPIHDIAFIIMSIDVIDMNVSIDDLLLNLKQISSVKAVSVIAYE